jgi:hypothetical protein
LVEIKNSVIIGRTAFLLQNSKNLISAKIYDTCLPAGRVKISINGVFKKINWKLGIYSFIYAIIK